MRWRLVLIIGLASVVLALVSHRWDGGLPDPRLYCIGKTIVEAGKAPGSVAYCGWAPK